MLEMSQDELIEAIHNLGDGHHQLKDIENQVIKDRHEKQKQARKSRRKKSIRKTV